MTDRIRARNARTPRVPLSFRQHCLTDASVPLVRRDSGSTNLRVRLSPLLGALQRPSTDYLQPYQPPRYPRLAALSRTWSFTYEILRLDELRRQPGLPSPAAEDIEGAIEPVTPFRKKEEKVEEVKKEEERVVEDADAAWARSAMAELAKAWTAMQDEIGGEMPVPWELVGGAIRLVMEEVGEEGAAMMAKVVERAIREGKMNRRE